MKHKIALAAAVMVLMLVGAGVTLVRAAAPAAAGAKWEYRVLLSGPNAGDQCNDLGAQGWELVSVVSFPSGTNYYFKRPK